MGFIEIATQIAIKAVEKLPFERLIFKQRESQTSFEVLERVIRERGIEAPRAPVIQEQNSRNKQETVATACIPCSLGHFSTSTGLLNEAIRFKGEGMTSNEILDRIAKTLEELNTLERVDLSPERIQSASGWERDLIEEVLQQSRSLRHRLETITTVKELEQAAADTEGYYKRLFREWSKRRSAAGKAEPEMTLDEAKKMAAEEATKEVESRWHSQEKK